MRFLKENFGESEELNTFVNQANNRFRTYYVVTLVLDNGEDFSERYFAYKEAAQKYYDSMISEIDGDREYYGDNASVSLDKVTVNLNTENIVSNNSEIDNIAIEDNIE